MATTSFLEWPLGYIKGASYQVKTSLIIEESHYSGNMVFLTRTNPLAGFAV
jgi:hypothetical protein